MAKRATLPMELVRAWPSLTPAMQATVLEFVRAGARVAAELPVVTRSGRGLEVFPGGFEFVGRSYELRGRPLQILTLLADGEPVAFEKLQRAMGFIERGSIINYIGRLRRVLRVAVAEAGLDVSKDPLVAVDRGWGLGYRLAHVVRSAIEKPSGRPAGRPVAV